MRTKLALVLIFSGCQLLPQYRVLCTESDRCEPAGPGGPDGGLGTDLSSSSVVTAPFVLGQPDAQTNWVQRGLSSPTGVLMVGGKLLVADQQNSRLLIWNTFPTQSSQPADLVLGQEQLSTISNSSFAPALRTLPQAARLASDGTRLIVGCGVTAGQSANRLVFFNTFPATSYAPADFSLVSEPLPTAASATGFSSGSPLILANRLYLSDRGFNRVLLWNPAPSAATGATLAIGQGSLTGGNVNSGGLGAGSLSGPDGSPASDGTALYVPDTGNHRVLAWTTAPTTNTAANFVLGQGNATSNSPNRGGAPSLSTLSGPTGVALSGTRLAVADRGNHRVLLWNQQPTATGQAANLVLGQASATGNTANAGGLSAATLSSPTAVATDGTRLAVADTSNNRVLLYQNWPTANGQAADLILGQPGPAAGAVNGAIASATRYRSPTTVARAGNRLLVVDRDAHRVLIWPTLPRTASEQPTVVVGQADLTGATADSGGSISAYGFDNPYGVASDGTILVVSDVFNHRVLLWKNLPTQNRQPADLVLGQSTLGSGAINAGGPATGLHGPSAVWVAGNRLYVADTDNNRVLIWKNVATLTSGQQADLVLGQADFTGIGQNRNPVPGAAQPMANTLSGPFGVHSDASHIYVSDAYNSRVLIWNTLDPVNGQAADVVLGQPTFLVSGASPTANNSAVNDPMGLFAWNGQLYVSDSQLHRVAVWTRIPTLSNAPINVVLGQSDVNSGAPNSGGLTASRLQAPSNILATEVGIYIADTGNGRIVVLPPR